MKKKIDKAAKAAPMSDKKPDMPKKFSVEKELLDQTIKFIAQMPIRAAHKLVDSIVENMVEDRTIEEKEEKRMIIPSEMLNEAIGFLTTLPVFISMELITMINMGLKIPDMTKNKESKTVVMDANKSKDAVGS